VEFYSVVMQLCLIPTQPSTVTAGPSLLDFMEKILEGMMVQLFVEVDCCPGVGNSKDTLPLNMKHTHSLTKQNWEHTRQIVMADTNLQMSLLSLIRQLSSHTWQNQFLETSTYTYKAGREAGREGQFSFWHEPSNKPLLSVVQEDVEKYRSNTCPLYSTERMEELLPRPGLQKGVDCRPHRCSIGRTRECLCDGSFDCLDHIKGYTKLEE